MSRVAKRDCKCLANSTVKTAHSPIKGGKPRYNSDLAPALSFVSGDLQKHRNELHGDALECLLMETATGTFRDCRRSIMSEINKVEVINLITVQ